MYIFCSLFQTWKPCIHFALINKDDLTPIIMVNDRIDSVSRHDRGNAAVLVSVWLLTLFWGLVRLLAKIEHTHANYCILWMSSKCVKFGLWRTIFWLSGYFWDWFSFKIVSLDVQLLLLSFFITQIFRHFILYSCAQFLSTRHYAYSQNTMISLKQFENIDLRRWQSFHNFWPLPPYHWHFVTTICRQI